MKKTSNTFFKILSSVAMLFLGFTATAQSCKLVINENFNHYSGSQKKYTETMAKKDFPGSSGFKGLDGRTTVGDGVIQARYDKGKLLGKETGFTWFQNIPGGGVNEATMEYKIKFDSGFDWTLGGKIPGLVGGTSPRGCNTAKNNLENGFSARCMWRKNGEMVLYKYWHKQSGRCGTDTYWKKNGSKLKLQRGKWYTVKERIVMNKAGKNDGIAEIWLDGVKVLKESNIQWRKSGKNFKIDKAYWTTYVGGSSDAFRPSRNNKIWFDDLKVWINCSGNDEDNVDTNNAPAVSLTSPANNASFPFGQAIPLSATATDDGTVAKVNFKVNDIYYSQDVTGPSYTGTFTPTTPGVYKIAARAFDNKDLATEKFVTIIVNEPKGPYKGTPMIIPGVLEMEDYDKGGPNVSYMDVNADNKGGVYRNDYVDIESLGNGKHAVAWISTGEWLEYTVDVTAAGSYDIDVFYSSAKDDAEVNLTSDGNMLTVFNLPSTGGYDNYSTMNNESVVLSEGEQTLRFNVMKNGFNIDKIVFSPSTVTSTNELSATQSIVVYPNPNETGIFNLTQTTEWSVMTIQGTVLSNGNSDQINISDQNKGVYIIQLPHGVTKRVVLR